MQNNRNCGIDLLRLVLMFMVCMLHILGQGGVLSENNLNTAGYPVFRLLEVCSYCAVDGFAIISGYISTNRLPKWYKLTDMWFQVFFYSFILTVILRIAGVGSAIDIATYIRLLMPVTSKTFWYFSAYFNALILVVLFSRIKCQWSWITRLSSMAFGVYLFQLNTVIWNDILQSSMLFVTEQQVVAGVISVLFSAIMLFISGLTVEWLRSKVAKILKLSSLSMKIVDMTSNIVSRFIVLLK